MEKADSLNYEFVSALVREFGWNKSMIYETYRIKE